jgi:para-nitrobenzyl esterase
VPVIVLCVLGFLWSVPVPAAFAAAAPWLNWATLTIAAGLAYYALLSPSLALGMVPVMAAMVWALARLDALPPISQMTGANFLLDGQVLREDLWSAFRAGHEARVPLLIGANDQENAWPTPPEMKAARLKRFDRWVSPAERAQLVADYGGQDVFDGHFTGDLTFAAHAWSLAALHAVNGQPTWRYRFAALPDAARATLAGTPHAGELAYVFGNLGAAYWPTSARDAAVSAAVMDYWVEFARSGRPQPEGRPAWPRADADGVMLFEDDGPKPAARDDRTGRYRALGRYADPRS